MAAIARVRPVASGSVLETGLAAERLSRRGLARASIVPTRHRFSSPPKERAPIGPQPNHQLGGRLSSRAMAQSSFDIVSEVDMQEVRNAVDQASREIHQRFDFKNTDTSLSLAEDKIEMHSATEDRLKAAYQ